MIAYIILYLLCACLLRYTIERLIPLSKCRWKRILLILALFVLSFSIIYVGDLFNIIPTILIFLLCVFLSCEGSFWKKLTIGLILANTVFSFNALRDNYIISIYTRDDTSPIYSGLYSLLFSIFLTIVTRLFAPDKDYELSDSMWKLLLFLTAMPVGIVLSVVLLYDPSGEIAYSMINQYRSYAVLLMLSLLSCISLFLTISVLANQQKLNKQIVLADMNQSYYEAMEQQHFEIRRLKHDMANHIQILLSLPAEKREEYIHALSTNPAITQTLHYCGDTTVNAVLSVKESLMRRYEIQMQWNIVIPEELPFDKTDLCALFANALDNAIEACMRLEKKQRKILLESKAQKGLFCLRITNPFAPTQDFPPYDPSKSVRFPSSSKHDAQKHGLGFQSMHEIVTRYQGALTWKAANGNFELFLYMPL